MADPIELARRAKAEMERQSRVKALAERAKLAQSARPTFSVNDEVPDEALAAGAFGRAFPAQADRAVTGGIAPYAPDPTTNFELDNYPSLQRLIQSFDVTEPVRKALDTEAPDTVLGVLDKSANAGLQTFGRVAGLPLAPISATGILDPIGNALGWAGAKTTALTGSRSAGGFVENVAPMLAGAAAVKLGKMAQARYNPPIGEPVGLPTIPATVETVPSAPFSRALASPAARPSPAVPGVLPEPVLTMGEATPLIRRGINVEGGFGPRRAPVAEPPLVASEPIPTPAPAVNVVPRFPATAAARARPPVEPVRPAALREALTPREIDALSRSSLRPPARASAPPAEPPAPIRLPDRPPPIVPTTAPTMGSASSALATSAVEGGSATPAQFRLGPGMRRSPAAGSAGFLRLPDLPGLGRKKASPPADLSPEAARGFEALGERIRVGSGRTASDWISDAVYGLKSFARRETPVARLEKAIRGETLPYGPTEQMRYSQGGTVPRAKALFDTGRYETRTATKTPIAEALAEVGPENLEVFRRYLAAKRQDTAYTPRGLSFGVDPTDAARFVAEVEAKYPTVVKAAQSIAETNDFLARRAVEAGVITPETYTAWKKNNPVYYGRIERIVGQRGEPTASGPMSQPAFKGVKGGTQPIEDTLPAVTQNLEKMVNVIERGEVNKSFVQMLDDNAASSSPKDVSAFIRELSPEELRASPDLDAMVAEYRAANKTGKGPLTEDAVAEILDSYEKLARRNIAAVTIQGKPRFFEFRDPTLYEAVIGLDAPPVQRNAVIKAASSVLSGTSKAFRAGTTTLSAGFQLSQFLRDWRTAYVQTSNPSPLAAKTLVVDIPAGYAKALASTAGRTGIAKQLGVKVSPDLLAESGVQGLIAQDFAGKQRAMVEAISPNAAQRARQWTVDSIAKVGDAIENGPRRAEFESVLKRYGYKWDDADIPRPIFVEATNTSRNVTTPFALGSDASKAASRLYPFFNARIQANYTLLEFAKRNPAAAAARIMAISVLPRIALWLKNKDEDWYKDTPDWRKYGFWNVGDGVSLPGLGLIDAPAVAIEFALNSLAQDDPTKLSVLLGRLADDLSPLGDVISKPGGMIPQVVKGPLEVYMNKDTFTERDIVPASLKDFAVAAPERTFKENTSKAAIRAAELSKSTFGAVPLNPIQIEHLIGSYFGSVGKELARSAPSAGLPERADIPALGRLFPRARESQVVRDFYDMRTMLKGRRAVSIRDPDETVRGEYATSAKVVTFVDKLEKAMDAQNDAYKNARTAEERERIAAEMQRLATFGVQIMEKMGVSR